MNKKKLVFILCIFIVAISIFMKVTAIEGEDLLLSEDSKSACLIESTTKEVIYKKNENERLSPASMTKIMTMTLVMEKLEKGIIKENDMVTTPAEAAGLGGSQIYLSAGEKMSVKDLLKSTAIASANDAAMSLAVYVGGSEKTFVKMMNDKVKELGLSNTNFVNPYGFDDPNHYSSSYDMAIMGSYLVENYPAILEYTSLYEDYVREDTVKRFWLVNTNKLVRFLEGVDGLKTGWTEGSGYCLTATIKKNNTRFIAVTMGNSDPKVRNSEVTSMLNYATSNYEVAKIFSKGDYIEEVEDIKVSPKKYSIYIKEDVYILKRKGEAFKEVKTEKIIDYNNLDNIGTIKIYYDNELYKEVSLGIDQEVKKANVFKVIFEVLREIFLIS